MKPTQESFLKDVANHRMTVMRDDGVYRHIVFAVPGSWCMRFELITWPGFLCYVGDMGAFCFSRIDDMFAFFRDDRSPDKLRINLQYWAEKLQAADKSDGAQEWSPEKFKAVIEHYLDNDGEPVSAEVRAAVEEEVLPHIDEGQHEAYRAASVFNYKGFWFNDLWDHDFKEYTYRFIWCCYALAWGIRQYDAALQPSATA